MRRTLPLAVWLLLALAGCGGSGGHSSSSGTSYSFVTPPLNSTRIYSETIFDNANNTINVGVSDTVTTVNPDGSYITLSEDPSHPTVIVNGTDYSILTETISLNNSGQETSYVYTAADASIVTCTYEPHGSGPDFPVSVGEMWTLAYTFACGTQAPLTYSQDGTVVDAESVTVPAGTYSALKLESTLIWTDLAGTTRTQTITNWRDVNTLTSVKQEISIAYSGTIPTSGYAVSREILLQSSS
jgi:hypothetical protein